MSSRIIASQDVNELPPIVVILGECTPIKSVSDLRENRFEGKHVSGLALTPNLVFEDKSRSGYFNLNYCSKFDELTGFSLSG